MKRYYKIPGNSWETYFAVEDDPKATSRIDVQYSFGLDGEKYVNSYSLEVNTPARGTFDTIATNAIQLGEQITKQEWKDVKKAAKEWLAEMGE